MPLGFSEGFENVQNPQITQNLLLPYNKPLGSTCLFKCQENSGTVLAQTEIAMVKAIIELEKIGVGYLTFLFWNVLLPFVYD